LHENKKNIRTNEQKNEEAQYQQDNAVLPCIEDNDTLVKMTDAMCGDVMDSTYIYLLQATDTLEDTAFYKLSDKQRDIRTSMTTSTTHKQNCLDKNGRRS